MTRRATRANRPSKAADKRRQNGSGKRAQGKWRRRRLTSWAAATLIWLGVGLAAVVAYFAYDLPDVSAIDKLERAPSVTLLAADGEPFATFGELYGEPVQLRDLPGYVPQAVLATEDRRFYRHFGVDPIGIMRALWANWRAGGIVQGGSTITQQLAKNLFLTPHRTIKRKAQEVLLALYLESRFSKDDILTLYLNRVYFGAGTYGIDAAARKYFAKPATALTLQEAAMVAGLLKAPSRYAPTRDLAAARARAAVVLRNMVDAGYLAAAEADVADANPAAVASSGALGSQARYFADAVLEAVTDHVGRAARDLRVSTTLDPALQRHAEEQLAAVMASLGPERGAEQAALVAMADDGAVLAMVGGTDYATSQFNRATQAMRQPGSAFKPFVYLAGLEAGIGPNARMVDRPVEIDGWRPSNYSGGYIGDVRAADALARSINSVAVQISERAGRERVIETAHRLGIVSPLRPHPSIALGTSEVTLLELTSAYVPFANDGQGVFPYMIREIQTREGEVLYRRGGSGLGRVVDADHARAMTRMLKQVIDEGTGRAARLDRPAAGKTGTSQDFRDAWFVGYAAGLTAGVWVGNDDASPMKRVTGGGLPARIWQGFMTAALEGKPARPLIAQEKTGGGSLSEIWQRIVERFGEGGSSDGPTLRGEPPN